VGALNSPTLMYNMLSDGSGWGGCGWLWVVVGDCGWLQVVAGGWLWVVVGGCGWLWVAVGGCGWLWVVVGGCGWLWVVVGGCGWLWVVVGGCGWLWVVVGGCGWILPFWKIQSPHSHHSTSYPLGLGNSDHPLPLLNMISITNGVGALLRWIGMPFCVGRYSLLLRGWLKLFKTTPKGVGALLRWVGMPVCVGWYSLLLSVWLKCFETTPKVVGATEARLPPPWSVLVEIQGAGWGSPCANTHAFCESV
jgi:hypothetical protein